MFLHRLPRSTAPSGSFHHPYPCFLVLPGLPPILVVRRGVDVGNRLAGPMGAGDT